MEDHFLPVAPVAPEVPVVPVVPVVLEVPEALEALEALVVPVVLHLVIPLAAQIQVLMIPAKEQGEVLEQDRRVGNLSC